MIMNKETTMTVPTLTGEALLTKVNAMREVNATNTEIAHACGYTKDNGNPAFVDFYTALLEAKFPEGLPVEDDFEEGSKAAELAESYPAEAIQTFIDYWGEDDLDGFEDAYHGDFGSGAEFAKDLIENSYGVPRDLPYWVEFDWEATWQNLSEDFVELDGFIFSLNW